jgi:hypothetical protein
MIKLGLRPVKDVPCLFTNERLIVFFYVDDIVVLVHPDYLDNHQQFERRLEAVYELRKLGELKWFLGIRVLRDWTAGKIWLIQDSFIDKVVKKFDLDLKSGGRYPAVPLVENSFGLSEEETNHVTVVRKADHVVVWCCFLPLSSTSYFNCNADTSCKQTLLLAL